MMTETTKDKKYSDKFCNYLVMAGHFFADINQGALSACLPFLVAQRGYSYAAVTMLILMSNVASSVIQPLFGTISDRKARPWLMPLGIFLCGLGLALVGLTDSYEITLGAACLSGLGGAIFHPEGGRISNLAAGEKKGSGMSIFAVGGNIGFFVGPILLTVLVTLFGMQGTMFFLIPATCSALFILKFNKRFLMLGVGTAKSQSGESREHWGQFWLATTVMAIRGILQYGLLAFIPLFVASNLGQSSEVSSLTLSFFSVIAGVATLSSGAVTQRFGVHRTTIFCLSMLAVLLVLFSNCNIFSLSILLICGLAIFDTLFYPSYIALGMSYIPAHLGTASGISYGIVFCFGGATQPLLGIAGDMYGLQVVMLIMAGISLI
jgi:MFS transporter, FSR family, fosmidomycin resistance protein